MRSRSSLSNPVKVTVTGADVVPPTFILASGFSITIVR